jgi:hypothetical protein
MADAYSSDSGRTSCRSELVSDPARWVEAAGRGAPHGRINFRRQASPKACVFRTFQFRPQGHGAAGVASCVPMKRRAFIAGLGKAAALVLLVTSQFEPAIAETSQQDQVFTATASASSESSACSASEGRAYNLCMVRGFFNITGVSCTCTQRGTAGAPIWECEGTATCKK